MTQEQFSYVWTMLVDSYPTCRVTESNRGAYYSRLQRLDSSGLMLVVEEWCDKEERFPTISQIQKAYEVKQAGNFSQVQIESRSSQGHGEPPPPELIPYWVEYGWHSLVVRHFGKEALKVTPKPMSEFRKQFGHILSPDRTATESMLATEIRLTMRNKEPLRGLKPF